MKRDSSPEAEAEFIRIKALLRRTAEESGLTQEEIGLKMGYERAVARSTISYILSEKSNPTLKMIVAFAKAVGVSLRDIFSDR